MRSRVAVVIATAVALTLSSAASADEAKIQNDAGMGAASAAASLIYAPTKLVYATGGGLVAGMAYLVSGGDQDVAKPILDASMRGDYVLTREHLKGQRSIEFVGRNPEARELRAQADAWEDVNSATEESAETYQTEEEYGPWRTPEEEGRDSAWVSQ